MLFCRQILVAHALQYRLQYNYICGARATSVFNTDQLSPDLYHQTCYGVTPDPFGEGSGLRRETIIIIRIRSAVPFKRYNSRAS